MITEAEFRQIFLGSFGFSCINGVTKLQNAQWRVYMRCGTDVMYRRYSGVIRAERKEQGGVS